MVEESDFLSKAWEREPYNLGREKGRVYKYENSLYDGG